MVNGPPPPLSPLVLLVATLFMFHIVRFTPDLLEGWYRPSTTHAIREEVAAFNGVLLY